MFALVLDLRKNLLYRKNANSTNFELSVYPNHNTKRKLPPINRALLFFKNDIEASMEQKKKKGVVTHVSTCRQRKRKMMIYR